MLELPTVTLLLFSPDDSQERSNRAGRITNYLGKHIKFGSSRVLSPYKPESLIGDWLQVPHTTWQQTQVWQSVGLHEFFDTDFVLHCETDGYPVHFDKWDSSFLDYDYIGAPWPRSMLHCNGLRVGNGGCSLQSRRFRDYLFTKSDLYKSLTPQIYRHINRRGMPSDVFFSQYIAADAIKAGIRYAPLDVARRFSYEHPIEEFPRFKSEDSFAFHGQMPWLQRYLTLPDV